MLAETTTNGNCNDIPATDPYQPYRECESDYEPAPALPEPMPGWRNQFPQFTHNVSWTDRDNKQHSMTIRTDDVDELFGYLKAVKQLVQASKAKAAESAPQAEAPATYEPDSDIPPCKIHHAPMERRTSKRTGGIYFSHKLPNGELCFGREKK